VVLSFVKVPPAEVPAELQAAQMLTPSASDSDWFRFHVYRHGEQLHDRQDFRRVHVEMQEQFILYANTHQVFYRRSTATALKVATIPSPKALPTFQAPTDRNYRACRPARGATYWWWVEGQGAVLRRFMPHSKGCA